MNWYAYKVLADTYDADRRRQAEEHRRARQGARVHRARRAKAPVGSPAEGTRRAAVSHAARSGRWASIVARLRRRPATTVVPDLRPSISR